MDPESALLAETVTVELKEIPRTVMPNGGGSADEESMSYQHSIDLDVQCKRIVVPEHGEFVYCHTSTGVPINDDAVLLRVWLRSGRVERLRFFLPDDNKEGKFSGPKRAPQLALSDDHTRLLVTQAFTVSVWDMSTEENTLTLEATLPGEPSEFLKELTQALELRFSVMTPSRDWVAAAGNSKVVFIWNTTSPQKQHTWVIEGSMQVTRLCTTANGRFLVAGVSTCQYPHNIGEVLTAVYDLENKQQVNAWPGHTDHIRDLHFSPTSPNLLFSGSEKGTFHVTDVESKKRLAALELPTDEFSRESLVRPSPDGRYLITVHGYRCLLWDVQRLECEQELPLSEEDVAWLPDGKHLVGLGNDGGRALITFALESREAEHVKVFGCTEKFFHSPCFSHDGRLVLARAYKQLLIFRTDTAERLAEIELSAKVRSPPPILCVTPNDTHVVCVVNANIYLFQLQKPFALENTIEVESGCVCSLAVTHDGRFLAAGTVDGYLCVWSIHDVTQPLHIASVVAHPDEDGAPTKVGTICALPDGPRILTGGGTQDLREWVIGQEACEQQHQQQKEGAQKHEGQRDQQSKGSDELQDVEGKAKEEQDRQQDRQQQQSKLVQVDGLACVTIMATEKTGISSLAYRASDGLVAMCADGNVVIYDSRAQRTIDTIESFFHAARQVAFVPNFDCILYVSNDKVQYHHLRGHTLKNWFDPKQLVDAFAIDSQQRVLVAGNNCRTSTLTLWPTGPLFERWRVPCLYDCMGPELQSARQCNRLLQGAHADRLKTLVPTQAVQRLEDHVNGEHVTFLAWLASSGERVDRLLNALDLVTPNYVDLLSKPSFLNTAITRSKDAEMVASVLYYIANAARVTDAMDSRARSRHPNAWTLRIGTLNSAFTQDVVHLIRHFPNLAAEFLDQLGLVKTVADKDYNHQETRLPTSQMIVVAHNSVDSDEQLWRQLRESSKLAKLEDSSAAPTLTEARIVPIPHAAGFLPDGKSFLEALVRADRPELFSSYIARAVVQFKWQTSGRRKFVSEALWYMVTVALITALTFVFNTNGMDVAQLVRSGNTTRGDDTVTQHGSDIASVALLLLLALMAGMDAIQEVRQSFLIASYWSDFWNWLDVTNLLLVLVVLGTYFGGWVHARAFLAIAVYLRWYGLLYYLQPFQSTGPLVRMILAICFDMRYFLLVLAISILAAWTSFRLLLLDDNSLPLEGLGDPANGLLLMFNMLLLADFELDTFDGEYVVLLRILFVLSMVLVPVVLLNLLIALMSDSYERIQDRADIEFQLLRAKILVEHEAWLSKEDRKKTDLDQHPVWLHVLVPKGSGVGRDESGTQWQGVLHALKKEVAEKVEGMEAKVQDVKSSMAANVKGVEKQVEGVKKQVEGVEKKMGGVEKKLQGQLADVRKETAEMLKLLKQLTEQKQQGADDTEGVTA